MLSKYSLCYNLKTKGNYTVMFLHFLVYGLFGWAVEILFTAVTGAVTDGNWQLKGITYVWMFPIYGFGGLLFEVAYTKALEFGMPMAIRLIIFLVGLYLIELIAGYLLLKLTGGYVWKYDGRWQFMHLINFLYAPAWLTFLVVLERLHLFLNRITIV